MTDATDLRARLDRRTMCWLLGLMALALIASWTTLPNQFVQDDAVIVLRDPGLQQVSLSRIFLEPYWPAPFQRDLYRPLTSLLLGLEWTLGGGASLPFRIISITLYVLTTLACWALARRLLPGPWAWGVAALFAVHPVHVEAVAVAVNQAELMVGFLLALCTAWYLERRQRGPLVWRNHLLIAGVMLIGGLFKEHAVVLPALLVLAELTVLRQQGSLRERLNALRPALILCTLVLVLLLLPRAFLFENDLVGTFTAKGLAGLSFGERALTMLQVVPRWIYLILWPATLLSDYSPRVIDPATSFGAMQAAGLLLLLLCLWVALRTLRDFPVIAFGLGWAAIAILPVSNVLIPTGIVLAERTLFTPSFGALLAVVALIQAVGTQFPQRAWLRPIAIGAVSVLVILGLGRSLERHTAWKDEFTYALRLVEDAPLSFRGWYLLGGIALNNGQVEQGRRLLHSSLKLYSGSGIVWFLLADSYRDAGRCAEAIPAYEGGLRIQRYDHPLAGLAACLMWEGQYARGREIALEGIRIGEDTLLFRTWLHLADSGLRVNAPPHTMRFPVAVRPSGHEPTGSP